MKKENIGLAVFLGIVFAVAGIAIFFALQTMLLEKTGLQENMMGQRQSKMSLTEFDKDLAIEFMDKDKDGKCDACGMPVEMCIETGQMQCSMDSKSTIGILDSGHSHADFKVYINGKPLNFADKNYYMKSSFIHVDDSHNKEDSGGVLHMHATGVPLWIFFRSIGMEFNSTCITLSDKQHCNDQEKKMKLYVNEKPNDQWQNYVFKDLDKILISHGNETNLSQQLSSITDFAKNH